MEDVVALHGFAGTGGLWDPVVACLDPRRWRVWAPDLPGHGTASAVRPVTVAACVGRVLEGAPERFVACGYSMGGRVALALALAAPERVAGLVLVAATAGIEDAVERAARRRADEQLAAEFERIDIDELADRWIAQPLFAGDPSYAHQLQRNDVLRNDPRALAAALRGLGPGETASLWERLGALGMPVTVMAGERDTRYLALGERLVSALSAARPLVAVPGAGHGLPREAPEAVAAAIAGTSDREAR